MLLVVFGAGASYDSMPEIRPRVPYPRFLDQQARLSFEDDRPPLANELFGNRPQFVTAMDRFPDCKALIPCLRKPGIAVEKELASIQQQAAEFPRVHCELAAIRYYLHTALTECQKRWDGRHSGITNYVTLVREIERWRLKAKEKVCFVTFNYDTMLEDAMSSVLGIPFDNLDGYVCHDEYAVIKLHGSVNWGREIEGLSFRADYPHAYIIREIEHLHISERYTLVSDCPMLRNAVRNYVFPALSIPVENKDQFSCPPAHVQKMQEALPLMTKLITIGWRATERDFLKLLLPHAKHRELLVVSGTNKGLDETVNNLGRGLLRERVLPLSKGFTGLIVDGLEQLAQLLKS
jgi:hypothetical protein